MKGSNKGLKKNFFNIKKNQKFMNEVMKLVNKHKKNVTAEGLKNIYISAIDKYNLFQFKEAELLFSTYHLLNPYDHRGISGLVSISLEREDFKQSLELLNVLKTYPTADFDEVILTIAYCYYKLKDYVYANVHFLIVDSKNLYEFNLDRYEELKNNLEIVNKEKFENFI